MPACSPTRLQGRLGNLLGQLLVHTLVNIRTHLLNCKICTHLLWIFDYLVHSSDKKVLGSPTEPLKRAFSVAWLIWKPGSREQNADFNRAFCLGLVSGTCVCHIKSDDPSILEYFNYFLPKFNRREMPSQEAGCERWELPWGKDDTRNYLQKQGRTPSRAKGGWHEISGQRAEKIGANAEDCLSVLAKELK